MYCSLTLPKCSEWIIYDEYCYLFRYRHALNILHLLIILWYGNDEEYHRVRDEKSGGVEGECWGWGRHPTLMCPPRSVQACFCCSSQKGRASNPVRRYRPSPAPPPIPHPLSSTPVRPPPIYSSPPIPKPLSNTLPIPHPVSSTLPIPHPVSASSVLQPKNYLYSNT